MSAVGEFEKRVLALVRLRDGGSGVEDVTSGAQGAEEEFRGRESVRNCQFDASHDLTEGMHFGSSLLQTFLPEERRIGLRL